MIDTRLARRTFVAGGGASLLGIAFWQLGAADPIEDLGPPPVNVGRLHDMRLGPNERGELTRVYMAFAQATDRPPFLLMVDAIAGSSRQFYPPSGAEVQGFKSVYVARDGWVYVGGYAPARLLRLDPRRPDMGLQDLGVLPDANMIWWMLEAADDRVYMTTSGEARLYSWDPAKRAIHDHGGLSTENKYATVLLATPRGDRLYAVVAPQRYDVVAYDVASGARRGLLPASERGIGFIGILRGDDGRLRAELTDDTLVRASDEEVVGLPQYRLDDGRWLRATAEELTLIEGDGTITRRPLKYEAQAWLNRLHAAPDGSVFASTESPLRVCHYSPSSRTWKVLGNPFAEADTGVAAVGSWKGTLLLAAYPGTDLAVYDPSREWQKGPTPSHNPWTWGKPDGIGHTRPSGIVVGRDGLIYVASDAAYGVNGGAVACIDPATGKTVYNLRDVFLDRSVVSIAADPSRAVVYIGCTRRPSADGRQSGASVIAWDTARRRILWEDEPWPGAESVSALAYVGGRLYGMAYHDYDSQQVFVLAPSSGRTLYRAATGVPAVIQNNLRLHGRWLYGLSYVEPTLFGIDPETWALETVARIPAAQGYTFALVGNAAYFSSGSNLLRLRLDGRSG